MNRDIKTNQVRAMAGTNCRVTDVTDCQIKGNTIYSKKYSHIKKQIIVQKYMHLLQHFNHLLLFHYNNKQEHNWQQMKEKLGGNADCKSLLVPGNLFQSLISRSCSVLPRWHDLRLLTQGPTLLVTCSSTGQMAAIVEAWKTPDLVLIGGMYKKHPLSHLDIKRWVLLHKEAAQPHLTLLQSLAQWQTLIPLLHISQGLRNISHPLHSLIQRLQQITSCDHLK